METHTQKSCSKVLEGVFVCLDVALEVENWESEFSLPLFVWFKNIMGIPSAILMLSTSLH